MVRVDDVGSCPSGNASNPSVASWSAGNLQVYERGRDGNIYQDISDGSTWSGWRSIGEPASRAVSDPAAFSRANNDVNVVTRAADGHIYSTHWDGAIWSGWTSLDAQ